MVRAYLQDYSGKYFVRQLKIGELNNSEVILSEEKTPLKNIPEEIEVEIKENSISILKDHKQQRFSFTGDGYVILATQMFSGRGIESKCILTLEGDKIFCGNLDFLTAVVKVGISLDINCVPF